MSVNLTEIMVVTPMWHAVLIGQESGKTTEASSDGILWIDCLMDCDESTSLLVTRLKVNFKPIYLICNLWFYLIYVSYVLF